MSEGNYESLVVHCKKSPYDVYIGRPSKWGNPFTIGKDGTRAEVIEKHRLWLMEQPDLLNSLDELKGKRLGCWCRPEACHGDLLAILANDVEYRKLFMFDWNPNSLQSSKKRSLEMDRKERLEKMLGPLGLFVKNCSMCVLCKNVVDSLYNPHVFSTMNPSRWMVVGQNPGVNECKQGVPFVGDAGRNFDEALQRNGCSREDFYISNAVKCFTVDNEKPSFEHMSACRPILQLEIAILRPRLVITLGNVAFDVFCPKLQMSDHLGEIVRSDIFGVNVYPIYHPSPRNINLKDRKEKFDANITDLCRMVLHYKLEFNKGV
jgi:uracil-DNA glycosylase family 4